MEPLVDLAPGAEHEPLAMMLAQAVERSVRVPERRQAFESLRGTVGIVVDDSASALTLRFDFGRLTIHEGLVGVPTVTVRGTRDNIEALTQLPMVSGFSLRRRRELVALSRRLLSAWLGRQLKIYGLSAHPRFVVQFLTLLSPEAPAPAFDAPEKGE